MNQKERLRTFQNYLKTSYRREYFFLSISTALIVDGYNDGFTIDALLNVLNIDINTTTISTGEYTSSFILFMLAWYIRRERNTYIGYANGSTRENKNK